MCSTIGEKQRVLPTLLPKNWFKFECQYSLPSSYRNSSLACSKVRSFFFFRLGIQVRFVFHVKIRNVILPSQLKLLDYFNYNYAVLLPTLQEISDIPYDKVIDGIFPAMSFWWPNGGHLLEIKRNYLLSGDSN